jgi:hypothetical protein
MPGLTRRRTDIFNHFVVMLIAVNLQLVLVHGVSTAGFMRYYLGGAVLATLAIGIPPAAYGVWGWNTEGHVCFINRPDAELRRWDILAVQAWTASATLVAMLCTAAVLAKLVRMRRRLSTPDALQSAQLAAVAWRIALYPAVLCTCPRGPAAYGTHAQRSRRECRRGPDDGVAHVQRGPNQRDDLHPALQPDRAVRRRTPGARHRRDLCRVRRSTVVCRFAH